MLSTGNQWYSVTIGEGAKDQICVYPANRLALHAFESVGVKSRALRLVPR